MAVMRKNFVGYLNLYKGIVDISDPCYDCDTFGRIDGVKVFPGKYACYAYIDEEVNRVMCCQIVIDSNKELSEVAQERISKNKSWRRLNSGFVGVDSGLAGFFASPKPDFSCQEEWFKLCDWMYKSENLKNKNDVQGSYILSMAPGYSSKEGFYTNSGYGDGAYTVHAIRENRKIIALEIRFW